MAVTVPIEETPLGEAMPPPTNRTAVRFNPITLIQNALVLGLWLWLYRSTFPLLQTVTTREDFRTNQVILIGIVLLLVMRLRESVRDGIRDGVRDGVHLRLDAPLRWHAPAIVLLGLASVAYLITEHLFDVNIIAACLFGIGSYGLLGLWISPQRWREGLPAALLLIGVLPFGDHIDTFIGYPMRILTAEIVQRGLNLSGVTSLGLDTILVFENSVAQIDVPCSGVKSLWTGGLFLLAATWIDRRPINPRWLLIALTFVVVLFVANLARVSLLIVAGPVLGWVRLAELIHVPLGVVMFVLACGVAVVLLRVDSRHSSQRPVTSDSLTLRGHRFPLILIATLIIMNLIYTVRPRLEAQQTASTLPPNILSLPAQMQTQSMELRSGELAWLAQDGAEAVQRARFNWHGRSGTLLIVQSTSWRAHHKPERCFENYGLRPQETHTQLVDGQWPVRALSLGNGKAGGEYSALYWFQSAEQSTDDYGVRLWSALSLQPPRWLLITVLFDGPYLSPNANNPLPTDIAQLVETLHQRASEHLKPSPQQA